MESINGNCGVILNEVRNGNLKIGDKIYSEVNNQAYEITETKESNGTEWITLIKIQGV